MLAPLGASMHPPAELSELSSFWGLLHSQERLDEARYQLAAAEQGAKLAAAKLAKLDAQLAETRLKAPFAGVIVVRDAELGQLTQPGDALLRIEDHSRLELHARVKERDLALLEIGAAVEVRIDALGDKALPAKVRTIVPSGDADHTFLVEVALPAHAGVYPGMFGRVLFGD